MPVRLRCPGCQTAYQLPETLRGKTVRCKSCSKAFKVPGGPALATAGAAAAPRKLASDQAIKVSAKKTKPLPPDDDDDEPVAPRRKGKAAKKTKERKLSPMLLIGILAGAILVVTGVAVGAVMMFSGDSTKTAQTQGKKSSPQPNQQDTEQKKSSQKAPAPDPKDELVNGEPMPPDMAVSYTAHIKPFLATYCGKCHGDEVQKGNTNLQSYEYLMKGGRMNRPLVTKSEPDKSNIVTRVEQKQKGMPPRNEKQPTTAEKSLLRRWIQAGAVDDSGMAGGLLQEFDLRLHNEAIDLVLEREHALNSRPFGDWPLWAFRYRGLPSIKLK